MAWRSEIGEDRVDLLEADVHLLERLQEPGIVFLPKRGEISTQLTELELEKSSRFDPRNCALFELAAVAERFPI
jgi:hypothetical protein